MTFTNEYTRIVAEHLKEHYHDDIKAIVDKLYKFKQERLDKIKSYTLNCLEVVSGNTTLAYKLSSEAVKSVIWSEVAEYFKSL